MVELFKCIPSAYCKSCVMSCNYLLNISHVQQSACPSGYIDHVANCFCCPLLWMLTHTHSCACTYSTSLSNRGSYLLWPWINVTTVFMTDQTLAHTYTFTQDNPHVNTRRHVLECTYAVVEEILRYLNAPLFSHAMSLSLLTLSTCIFVAGQLDRRAF